MSDSCIATLRYIKTLAERKFTGQLRINFHKGDISKKTLLTIESGVMAYEEKVEG